MEFMERAVKWTVAAVSSVAMVIFLAFTVTLASQHDSTADEVKSAAASIKDYSIEQKDAAVAKAQELIENMDDEMHVWEGRFKEKWADLKDSSKEKYNVSKEEIKKQREDVSEWLDKLENSTAEAWEDMKHGFVNTYNSFADSWKKTAKEVSEEM